MDLCIEEKVAAATTADEDKKRKRQTLPLAAYVKFSHDNRPRILKENPGLEVEGVVRLIVFSMILFPLPRLFTLCMSRFIT